MEVGIKDGPAGGKSDASHARLSRMEGRALLLEYWDAVDSGLVRSHASTLVSDVKMASVKLFREDGR